MGSEDSPTTWVPYTSNQDCSQNICNVYCPQLCNYFDLLSPPPPVGFSDDDSGGAGLSPLMITIIGVFGSACLLISYYVIISRLCIVNNNLYDSLRHRGVQNQETLDHVEMSENDFNMEDDPLNLRPWSVPSKGLDEVTINSIRVCMYKKGDSLVAGTDCPVCLGEFQEDEKLRILPKCSHAFHLYCIDNWLANHSNCPLCRTNVSCDKVMSHIDILPPPSPPPPPPPPPPPRPDVLVSSRIPIDLEGQDAIIDIRDEEGDRHVRRSVSMGNLCQNQVSVAEILFVNQCDDMESGDLQVGDDVGSSINSEKYQQEEDVGSSKRFVNGENTHLNCGGDVRRDMLKRSFSSGRYLFIRGWKGKTLKVSSVPT